MIGGNMHIETQEEMTVQALQMRCNYIETGDVCLSRDDAVKRKMSNIIKTLTPEQEELVAKMKSMIFSINMGGKVRIAPDVV
jgi:hypothetical protein